MTRGEGLVPTTLISYDPTKDRVVEEMRKEVHGLLAEPLTPASLRMAISLLESADQIIQLRKGAPRALRRNLKSYNVTNSYAEDEDGEEESGPIAGSSATETMGTHAFREIIGAVTHGIEALTKKDAPKEPPAFAAGAYIRAINDAKDLPDDIRPSVVTRLRAALDTLLREEEDENEPKEDGDRPLSAALASRALGGRALALGPASVTP